MSRGRPQIAIRLTPNQITGLKIIAKRNNTTISDLIRDMVESLLWANGIDADPPEQQQRTSHR